MVRVFAETGGLVYTDWFKAWGDPGTPLERFEAVDFDCPQILDRMGHLMTSIVPTRAHRQIGGFNEELPGWEDWDYLIRIHGEAGVCGHRVEAPLVVYRFTTGDRRSKSAGEEKPGLVEHLRTTFRKFYKQEAPMGCRKCPGGKKSTRRSFAIPTTLRGRSQTGRLARSKNGEGDMIKIQFNHPNQGKMAFRGKATGHRYRFVSGRTYYIYEEDMAAGFESMTVQGQKIFQPIAEELPQVPIEVPTPVMEEVAAGVAVEYPEAAGPLPELEGFGLTDPATLTIGGIRDLVPTLDAAELAELLSLEKAGKNRKGAKEAIEAAL
jgi:hypothetical protein